MIRTSDPKVSLYGAARAQVGRGSLVLGLLAMSALVGGCKKSAPSDKVAEQSTAALTSSVVVGSSAVVGSNAEPAIGGPAPNGVLLPSASATPGAAASGAELAITWSDPPEWERVTPKSRMRLAQYKVKPVAGDTEPGEVTLFHFGPNMGGGVEENITRWTNQFSGVDAKAIKRTTKTNGELSHHLVQIESGQFQSSPMMGGPPNPNPSSACWVRLPKLLRASISSS